MLKRIEERTEFFGESPQRTVKGTDENRERELELEREIEQEAEIEIPRVKAMDECD